MVKQVGKNKQVKFFVDEAYPRKYRILEARYAPDGFNKFYDDKWKKIWL